MVDNGKFIDISPIEAKLKSSDSSRPFAGPILHLSVPCFAKASLNFLICLRAQNEVLEAKIQETHQRFDAKI